MVDVTNAAAFMALAKSLTLRPNLRYSEIDAAKDARPAITNLATTPFGITESY